MTFLEIVQKQGYQTISDYLSAVEPMLRNISDLSEKQMRNIRKNEAATEAYLEA